MITPTALTVPALLLAGMQTSAHCVVMCAGFNASMTANRPGWVLLHLGRLFSYMLWGLAAGLIGQQLLLQLPGGDVATPMRVGLGAAVMLLGLVHVHRQKHATCAHHAQSDERGWRPLLRGVLWGFVPCPVLYGAVFVAALSASPWGGSILMLAFGLGTLPAFILQNEVLRRAWLQLSIRPEWRGYGISAIGAVIIVTAVWMPESFGVFCR